MKLRLDGSNRKSGLELWHVSRICGLENRQLLYEVTIGRGPGSDVDAVRLD